MDDINEIDLNLDNNSIAMAGEFAVLSQLALRGYDANLTLGHTKGVDILISNPKTNKMFKMEVKTHYRNTPNRSGLFGHTLDWILSDKNEHIISDNLYYCFVNIEHGSHNFKFYIIPCLVVANYVKESHQFWLKQTNGIDSSIRRSRLGLSEDKYNIDTLLAKAYEGKWELL